MKTPATPQAACCPLCGQANQCVMVIEPGSGEKQAPCWCTQVDFSADLLAQIPVESKGLACVCAACAKAGESPQGDA